MAEDYSKNVYGNDPQGEASRLKDDVFGLLNSQVGMPDRSGNDDDRASTDLKFPSIPVRKGK